MLKNAIIIITLMIFVVSCQQNNMEKKKEIQMYYIDLLLGNKCSKAQIALNEMKKLDPKDLYPLKYHDKKYDKVVTLDYKRLNLFVDKCNNNKINKRDINVLEKAGVFHAEQVINKMKDLQE